METFGQFIRRRRNSMGLTLTQLGAKIGVDSGALSKIENGKKPLDESVLPEISKVFNVELEEIRNQYFSEIIANTLYKNNCSDKVLILAEEKIKVLKLTNTHQGEIPFND